MKKYLERGPESDVSFHRLDDEGDFVCLDCRFDASEAVARREFITVGGAVEHLLRHRRNGHKVPAEVLAELRTEATSMLPRMMPGAKPYTADQWEKYQRLVRGAAEATEAFDEDDLEAFAARSRGEK